MLIFVKFVVLAAVLFKTQAFCDIMLSHWDYNPAVSKAPRSFVMSEATSPKTWRHIL